MPSSVVHLGTQKIVISISFPLTYTNTHAPSVTIVSHFLFFLSFKTASIRSVAHFLLFLTLAYSSVGRITWQNLPQLFVMERRILQARYLQKGDRMYSCATIWFSNVVNISGLTVERSIWWLDNGYAQWQRRFWDKWNIIWCVKYAGLLNASRGFLCRYENKTCKQVSTHVVRLIFVVSHLCSF